MDADRIAQMWRSASPATRLRIRAHAKTHGLSLDASKEAAASALEAAAQAGDASAAETLAAIEERLPKVAPKVVVPRERPKDLRVRLSQRECGMMLRIQRALDMSYTDVVRLAIRQYYVDLFEGDGVPAGLAMERGGR